MQLSPQTPIRSTTALGRGVEVRFHDRYRQCDHLSFVGCRCSPKTPKIGRPRSGESLDRRGVGRLAPPTGVNQIKSLYLIGGALNLSLSVCPCGSRSWIGAGAGVATTNTIGSEVTGSAPLVGNRVGGADAPPSNAKHRPPDSPTVDPSRPLCVTDRLWSCQRLLARPRTSSRCNMNSESTARLGGFLEVPKVSAARPLRTGRHPTCR